MKQTIHPILAQFREDASSNRDLGDRFERLICRYLELDPIYKERFSGVWMWNEFPQKGNAAAYALQSRLPGELKGKLPTAEHLADIVRAEMEKEAIT